jgi:hypothetical protein
MSDNHSVMQQQALPADDGWGDAAAEASERTIRGTRLRFSDWRWLLGKEAIMVEEGRQLVAVGTAAAWVQWENGKPVRTIMRQPGGRLPEREELGDLDQDRWGLGPDNQPKDPWQNTRFVYLIDPLTAEAYTFSTSSWGGCGAVIELGDAIARMRKNHPNAVPVVELQAAPMKTKFGNKSRPVFKIVSWKTAASEPAQIERQITDQTVQPQTVQQELDDEIPF